MDAAFQSVSRRVPGLPFEVCVDIASRVDLGTLHRCLLPVSAFFADVVAEVFRRRYLDHLAASGLPLNQVSKFRPATFLRLLGSLEPGLCFVCFDSWNTRLFPVGHDGQRICETCASLPEHRLSRLPDVRERHGVTTYLVRGLDIQGVISAVVDAPFGFPVRGRDRFVLRTKVDEALIAVYGNVSPSVSAVITTRVEFRKIHRKLVTRVHQRAHEVLTEEGASIRELSLLFDMTWTKTVGLGTRNGFSPDLLGARVTFCVVEHSIRG
jgi:hypothetical protein